MTISILGPLSSVTIKVKTPDGKMFVTIAEDVETGKASHIQINIGKAGSGLQAWASTTAELCSLALSLGAKVEQLIEINRVTSDRLSTDDDGHEVRSGPDGLAHALRVYCYSYSVGRNGNGK